MANARNLRPLGDVLEEEEESMADRFELPDPHGRDLASGPADTLGDDGDGEAGAQAPFGDDTSRANGSSIAVLLEYPKDKPKVRLLLTGDAWASLLEASISQLLAKPTDRLSLTGFKLPHHGSVANISAVFRHPHARTVELLLSDHESQAKPRLRFNYQTETTTAWSDAADQKARGYEAFHPKGISLIF